MKKTKFVNGIEYPYPMYLVRAGSGWQVRVPSFATRYFADLSYGGTCAAHAQAMQYLRDRFGVQYQSRPYASKEHRSKLTPTGEPGVFLLRKCRKGRATEYQLQVRVPNMPIKTLYVGTSSTWEARFKLRLDCAKEIRRKFVFEAQALAGKVGPEYAASQRSL